MTRFIPHGDMTADQIMRCSYEASAILRLCEAAAWAIQNGETPVDLADAIGAGTRVARDLLGVLHDALESHEGLKGGGA
ncbi:hypothetical protein J1C56_08910 [Aminobacter anthyllidis]|uniref:Uncharacterized protein n=1 Tax=Aminobacter anthyllidis TaxID=1035067 RepID=A0A9X1A9D9_9HYPH|nr:hypothetical protein [Aminobacter anthyllidis]MBT1155710.1 hypothetical protein [Aminobacter anthyllidis]